MRQCPEIELLATVGCKWGCQPFSCLCSLNATQCQKFRDLFVQGIHVHVHSTRILSFLRSAARFTSSAFLHHAPPFLAAAEKVVHIPCFEISRGSRSCGPKNCYIDTDCCKSHVTTVETKLLASVGWNSFLPAFQLPMLAKCDPLPKPEIYAYLLGMFV